MDKNFPLQNKMLSSPFSLFLVLAVLLLATNGRAEDAEVVILIVADDLGEAGFSGGGTPVPTRALDRVARASVVLPRFLTHSTCTPARSALLTGRYSHMSGLVGPADGQYGLDALPLRHKTMAEGERWRLCCAQNKH